MVESDPGDPSYTSDYGCFTGVLPYPETTFAPFVTIAAAGGSSSGVSSASPPNAPPNTAPAPGEMLDEHAADRSLGIDAEPSTDAGGGRGLKVTRVYPGSPAEGAGLRNGDVILSINGYSTEMPANLTWIIAKAANDRVLKMTVRLQATAGYAPSRPGYLDRGRDRPAVGADRPLDPLRGGPPNARLWEPEGTHDDGVMASLQVALKNAIQVLYQLVDGELAAEPLPDRNLRRLILFQERRQARPLPHQLAAPRPVVGAHPQADVMAHKVVEHRVDAAQLGLPVEDRVDHRADRLVRVEGEPPVRREDVSRRARKNSAAGRLVEPAAFQAVPHHRWLDLADGAPQAQEAVVRVGRVVQPVLAGRQDAEYRTDLDELVEILRGPHQAAHLQAEDDPDVVERHLGQQPPEAGAARGGRAAVPLVLVDDHHALRRPAEGGRMIGQRVLAVARLAMLGHLLRAGLPHIDDRPPLEVVRSDPGRVQGRQRRHRLAAGARAARDGGRGLRGAHVAPPSGAAAKSLGDDPAEGHESLLAGLRGNACQSRARGTRAGGFSGGGGRQGGAVGGRDSTPVWSASRDRQKSASSSGAETRPRWTRNSMLCSPFSDFGRTSEYTLPCGVTPPMTDRWSRVCHSSMTGVSASGA